jgi:hypothetical protein
MKLIPLTQGKFAQIDDNDLRYLIQYDWYVTLNSGIWYAMRSKSINGKRYSILMHREIFLINNIKALYDIDHKDNDGLNNQKSNLRSATHSQNCLNRGLNKNNTSGYKGVDFHRATMKFRARIHYQNESIYLGLFYDSIDAAVEYDRYAKRLFKEFAWLNFPEGEE